MKRYASTQEDALEAIVAWWRGDYSAEFRLGGLAGTGKTTIIAQLPALLGLAPGQVHFCAPTGKAARVLTRKLPGVHVATTIHRLMYLPSERHCEECERSPIEDCHGQGACGCGVAFRYAPPPVPPALVIVDEASMVTEYIYQHLIDLGSRLLFVGDHGQLPPVMGGVGIMDENTLDVKLEKIHRQLADSPILHLAMLARAGKPLPYGSLGAGVEVVSGLEYTMEIDEGTLLLCHTNRMRVRTNAQVRRALERPEEPIAGDKVVCLRNNNDVGVANGMLGFIEKIERRGAFYLARIVLDGEDRKYQGLISADQFSSDKTLMVRGTDLWTFGYCLTTHKAQGSEADDVVVFHEGSLGRLSPDDRRRWLYTAITRAKSTLTVVN